MEIMIKPLTSELINDYFDFFDHRAFPDDSPFYPCYCNAYNMSLLQIKEQLFARWQEYGEGADVWKRVIRESAWNMVNSGKIKGYLAYHDGISIGWCNANDRLNYYRVGEFNMDDIPEECFEISPDYRGMGIAGRILERICKDAAEEGYAFVEAYPMDHVNDNSLAFTGPLRLYEKFGFREYKRIGSTIVVRKDLRQL